MIIVLKIIAYYRKLLGRADCIRHYYGKIFGTLNVAATAR